jgi:hypothetical protein
MQHHLLTEGMMENLISTDPAEQGRYRRAKHEAAKLRGFYIHFTVYLLVNAGLLVLNVLLPHGGWWWQWSALGWGIGLAAHAAGVFLSPNLFGRDWEERKIKEIMARQ